MKDFKKTKAGYYHSEQCNIGDFKEVIEQKLSADCVPNSCEIIKNIPIYDNETLQHFYENEELKSELMAEWAWVLREGSGAVVIRNAYSDTSVIDQATTLY